MTTITFIDTGDVLTFTSLNPPPTFTILNPVPALTVSQVPGVGPVGPQGATGAAGATGPAGHAQLALSIPGPLSVMTGTMPFIFARDTTINGIAVAVGDAPNGDDIIFDVLIDGSTIFTVSPKPTIPDGTFEGTTVFVPDITFAAAGSIATVDVIQVGSLDPGTHGVLSMDTT